MSFDATFINLAKVSGRIRPWANSVTIGLTVAMIALAAVPAAVPAAAQSQLRQADEHFLRQLTERRFFDLAEEHCLRQIGQQTTPDRKAVWLLRLCEVYEQHAWFATAANRTGLLNSSVQQLTDFLQQQTPSVETEFDLRLQQVSTLISSVRISIIQAEAGHLFGSGTTTIPSRMLPQHTVTVDGAIQICTDLLQRLEKIRRELDPFLAREIRDAARMALTELHVLRLRIRMNTATDTPSSDVSQAADYAALVIRTGNAERKQRARWLLAEMAMVTGTDQEFGLKIGAVNDGPVTQGQPWGVSLKIRSLLKRQEATAAINLASESRPTTALQIQQLQWLKLEAILGLRELANQLDDAELLQDTAGQFAAQTRVVQKISAGVFTDAADAAVRRYKLVDEVGSEVADLVEQIDQQRTSGKDDVALALIERSLNRLSTTRSPRARGGLLLRAGEIQITKQQWAAAATRLQAAEQLFANEKMSSQQAISDLLHIFCQAQIWAANKDPETQPQLKATYIESLESHISRFAKQNTANRAQQWLLKVLEPDDPHRAASIAMDLFESNQSSDDRMTALLQAGDLLSVLNTAAAAPHHSLRNQFRKLAVAVRAESKDILGQFPVGQVAAAELCVLEFDIAASDVSNAEPWNGFASRLRAITAELAMSSMMADLNQRSSNGITRLRWKLLDTVIGARTSADSDRLQVVQQELLALSSAHKAWLPVVALLSEQFSGLPSRVGDIRLARTAEALISQALSAKTPAATIDDICLLLPHIVRAAEVTGESDLRSTALRRVFAVALNDRQLAEVVDAVSQTSNAGGGDPMLQKLWRNVIRQNVQGSEIWLEASLQLATIMATTKPADAKRQLDVIQTLYPDWGNAGRKQRAMLLSESLR